MTYFEKEEKSSEHVPKHHAAPKKHGKTIKKTTFWKISTGVLLVLLVILWFTGGSSGSISKSAATDKVLNFVNEQLLTGGNTASLNSINEEEGLYNIELRVNGQIVNSYVTKDGEIFFPQAINIDGYVAPNAPTPTPTAAVDMAEIVDDDSVKGDENAPVTIVEFSDYECPFCTRFYTETLSQIDEKYIKTGKAKFIYRDFPLGFHANAQKAAEAAECAGEQGKYYDMHDKLFEEGVSGGINAFKQYAQEIGLDTTEFNECLDSGEMASEVSKDFNDGQQLGVSGTPAFYINGQEVSGAQPFSVFEQIIEGELTG